MRVKNRFAKKKRNGNGRRSRADVVLAQGTGKTVTKAFGAGGKCYGLEGWDAFSPVHLPLPRSVAPYTVVRTTSLLSSSSKVNIIGTFAMSGNQGHRHWATAGLLRCPGVGDSVGPNQPINATNNGIFASIPFPGVSVTGSALSAVPAAISVQVMNRNPLMSTQGIVAAAVCPTQLDLRDRTETWNDFSQEFISFMRPRLLSAGKLSLRGVQMDAYPLNMAALADFRPVTMTVDGAKTLTALNTYEHPEGFTPIVIVNDSGEHIGGLELNFLVTIEWRVRFDIGNPAVSSHTHHGVTSDSHWDNLIKTAAARGAGVLDIVEKVANAGTAVANAVGRGAAAYRVAQAARALPMLAGA